MRSLAFVKNSNYLLLCIIHCIYVVIIINASIVFNTITVCRLLLYLQWFFKSFIGISISNWTVYPYHNLSQHVLLILIVVFHFLHLPLFLFPILSYSTPFLGFKGTCPGKIKPLLVAYRVIKLSDISPSRLSSFKDMSMPSPKASFNWMSLRTLLYAWPHIAIHAWNTTEQNNAVNIMPHFTESV